jgi:uncharacterized protein
MKWQRRLRYALGFALLYFIVCGAAGVFISEVTLHPGRRTLTAQDERQAQGMALRHGAQLMNISVPAADGVNLYAWRLRPERSNGEAVILLHGLSDNRVGMVGYAEMLVNRGFTVLMPDARAHGASGGAIATYGLLEADDIQRWYGWIEQHEYPRCIFGFGESMGAAQLLQTLRSESQFCAVAVESPFSTFREIAYDRVGQFFHTGPWLGRYLLRPVVETAFLYAHWRYHFDFEQISPEQSIRASKVPVLLIHGQQDGNIPVRHSRRIAASNSNITLWEVSGADHCGAITVAHEEFERRLIAWFEQHSAARSLVLVDF